jgi:hypothetical protein
VAPALPAGLSLNTTTGAISGTPTATAAQATYVVTATNASGSTTASLQISVIPAVAAPSSLSYPQASISATAGEPIIPDIPSFNGTATSFTVAPVLPAGVSFDTANGTISGTPTAQTPQASYTVTASNAGGSTTAVVSLSVNKANIVALELGHANGISRMRSISNRVLSQDSNGHWILWDSTADSVVSQGDQNIIKLPPNTRFWSVDMAGSTVAIGLANGLEVRSALDGHLLALIAAPTIMNPVPGASDASWWRLASDGSYVCAGSSAGLAAWSLNGQQLFSRQGNYSTAMAFAAPGQIQVALGPAGKTVIEAIAVSNGASTVGPAFSGNFSAWFNDGQRFLTSLATTFWTYSAAGVQQGIVSLPDAVNTYGQGNWIVAVGTSSISIYAVGANSASAVYPASYPSILTSGNTFAYPGSTTANSLSVVDLSGTVPSKSDITTPTSSVSAYTVNGMTWFGGSGIGVVFDVSNQNSPRTLTLGQAFSIAGGSTVAAVATADGFIRLLNPAIPSVTGNISFTGAKLAMSKDSSVLAAASGLADRTLNLYSLPSRALANSYPYSTATPPYLIDFSLSGSGQTLAQILYMGSSGGRRSVSSTAGGATIWSDTAPGFSESTDMPGSVQLSPDGTLFAVATGVISVNTRQPRFLI